MDEESSSARRWLLKPVRTASIESLATTTPVVCRMAANRNDKKTAVRVNLGMLLDRFVVCEGRMGLWSDCYCRKRCTLAIANLKTSTRLDYYLSRNACCTCCLVSTTEKQGSQNRKNTSRCSRVAIQPHHAFAKKARFGFSFWVSEENVRSIVVSRRTQTLPNLARVLAWYFK